MKVLSVFKNNNYYGKIFRKFSLSIFVRPERVLKNLQNDFRIPFFNLIYEMRWKLQKNVGTFKLNFIHLYENTLKRNMRKYLENLAYVTIILKKTTKNFPKNLASISMVFYEIPKEF